MKEKLKVLPNLATPYQKASCFWDVVSEELENCHQFLNSKEREHFRKYYNSMVISDRRHFLYFRDCHARGLQYLVSCLATNIRVLDAGCGTGSESILCGILGADVNGIDLSSERLTIAEKRLNFYQEQIGKPINAHFHAQSIFNLPDDSFHVIWVQQAISHIEPADKFIKLCYHHLEPKGKLIISDSNALNPYIYLQAKKEQWKLGGTYTTKQDPGTGKEVSYAQERLFSILSICKMLRVNGFHVKKVALNGFCPYLPMIYKEKPLTHYINRVIGKVPLVNLLGGEYVVNGIKI